ncbi:MAG: FxsA family protein [Succinatimonas sp.]|nr:FxsA family protein [Succinatimonas sp.]
MGRFIAAFAVLFVLELAVIIKVGTHLGALATLTALFAFMVLGAVLVKLRFKQALLELQNNQQPSLHIMWLPISGFFFIFPGFLSDLIAVLLLFPKIQRFIEEQIKKRTGSGQFSQQSSFHASFHSNSSSTGRTIEGSCTEVRDEDESEVDLLHNNEDTTRR